MEVSMIVTYAWSFFLCAFLGWLGQVIFAAFKEKRFVNRGFLNAPLCPVYGFGAVVIQFLLQPFRNLAVILVGAWILGTAVEYLTGFFMEKIFRQKWWDYSDQPHNLRGYVCLKFSVLWGVMGTVIYIVGIPLLQTFVRWIPSSVGNVILLVLAGLLVVDFAITIYGITSLNRKLRELEYVSGKMKDAIRLEAHTPGRPQEDVVTEAIRLKKKYEGSLKANRLHIRLLKAFPGLKSLRYNHELEELRRSIDEFRIKSSELLKKRQEAAIAAYEVKKMPAKERPFASGLCFNKLFWIFMIGNVVGCVLETAYALLVPPHQFEIRVSLVLGPFILVYGFGAVVITLCLYRLYHQKDVLIFLASMVIGASFEYACSFAQQLLFGTVSWEYSDSPLNLGGRTNLMYAFFWGVLGLVWVKDMYPALSRFIERIPKRVGVILTVATAIFMVGNMALSAGAVARQSARINDEPATNQAHRFFDHYYPDDYLRIIYPHMQYVGKPELPEVGPGTEYR